MHDVQSLKSGLVLYAMLGQSPAFNARGPEVGNPHFVGVL